MQRSTSPIGDEGATVEAGSGPQPAVHKLGYFGRAYAGAGAVLHRASRLGSILNFDNGLLKRPPTRSVTPSHNADPQAVRGSARTR